MNATSDGNKSEFRISKDMPVLDIIAVLLSLISLAVTLLIALGFIKMREHHMEYHHDDDDDDNANTDTNTSKNINTSISTNIKTNVAGKNIFAIAGVPRTIVTKKKNNPGTSVNFPITNDIIQTNNGGNVTMEQKIIVYHYHHFPTIHPPIIENISHLNFPHIQKFPHTALPHTMFPHTIFTPLGISTL